MIINFGPIPINDNSGGGGGGGGGTPEFNENFTASASIPNTTAGFDFSYNVHYVPDANKITVQIPTRGTYYVVGKNNYGNVTCKVTMTCTPQDEAKVSKVLTTDGESGTSTGGTSYHAIYDSPLLEINNVGNVDGINIRIQVVITYYSNSTSPQLITANYDQTKEIKFITA